MEEAAFNTGQSTVYVRLLHEGTEVSRPTQALLVKDGVYRLLPNHDYNPEDEQWEFPPGSMIRVTRKISCDGDYLLAKEIAN